MCMSVHPHDGMEESTIICTLSHGRQVISVAGCRFLWPSRWQPQLSVASLPRVDSGRACRARSDDMQGWCVWRVKVACRDQAGASWPNWAVARENRCRIGTVEGAKGCSDKGGVESRFLRGPCAFAGWRLASYRIASHGHGHGEGSPAGWAAYAEVVRRSRQAARTAVTAM